jgi:hypothetical protein
LPGNLLGGEGLGALSPILGDVGAVTSATGGLLGGVAGIVGDLSGGGAPVVGNLLTPVTAAVDGVLGGHPADPLGGLLGGSTGGGLDGSGALLGTNAPLQPVGDVANTVIDAVHATLEQVGHEVPGLNDPVHAVINLGNSVGLGQLGEASNPLTDAANLPGAVLTGGGAPAVAQLANDVGHVADATGGVLGAVAGALPAAGADGHGAGTPLDGALAAATTLLGATEAGSAGSPVGGLLGGLTGTTTGQAEGGTHPLIDLSAGPTTTAPVAQAAVLTDPADPAHTVQASAIGVSGDQPSAVTASLLSSDGIVLPQTSGGADQLVGQVLSSVPAGAPTSEAGSSHDLHVDLGIVSVDLGSHAEVQHTDPTPHTTTSGLHLLGL